MTLAAHLSQHCQKADAYSLALSARVLQTPLHERRRIQIEPLQAALIADVLRDLGRVFCDSADTVVQKRCLLMAGDAHDMLRARFHKATKGKATKDKAEVGLSTFEALSLSALLDAMTNVVRDGAE